ncbi:MAG: methylmalonyl Co-A mutase-associated GTPase MeaB [bacterium]|nr:methylmalonyl Co-A mutase-associated GTPase MeaB [bacterium]
MIAEALKSGDRRALGRAITLVESTRAEDEEAAARLLESLAQVTPARRRIGISGAPGVGKSTFIEAIGLKALDDGWRVAVITIDPSSTRSGGSILGDRTRMERLSRHPLAFIRSSPSRGTLGGVARRTRDVIRLVEAAGHDLVIVETVGVGQSEVTASAMTDMFVVLLAPGAGDGLQGVKRGIMELADLVIVNKADGELAGMARHMVTDFRQALSLMRPGRSFWATRVMSCSALTGDGLDDVRAAIDEWFDAASPHLDEERRRQAVEAIGNEVADLTLARLMSGDGNSHASQALADDVASGRMPLRTAARKILDDT